MVRFNFKGHSWPSVLEWIADISEMSLDWQELPEGYLNLITRKKYTVDEARDMINRHLLARGFTMLLDGEVISVFKIEKINPGMVPRVTPEELAQRQPHEFVKVSFTLDWLLAGSAAEELKPMMSPNGKLTPMQATNRLEAMDAVLNLRQVHAVLMEEQSDSGQGQLVKEFILEHTSAEEVVEHLNTLLGSKSNSAPKGPVSPQQMEAMKRQHAMQAEMAKKAATAGWAATRRPPSRRSAVSQVVLCQSSIDGGRVPCPRPMWACWSRLWAVQRISGAVLRVCCWQGRLFAYLNTVVGLP